MTFTAQATAQERWPALGAPPAVGGGENDAAVIVGVEDYFVAPDISGAVDNARDWYTWLVQGRGVPVERTMLLRNQEGTREKILKRLKEAAAKVEPGGTLWFIFIGHGAPGRDGKGGVLVGVDAQQEAENLYARSVTQDELLAQLPTSTRSVVVLDACFSGRTGSGDPLVPGLQPMVPVTPGSERPRNGLVLLSAGAPDQFAGPLPGASRPAFSYLLLGGLRGWADANSDQSISAQEAIDYTRVTLAATLRDRSQTPTLVTADRAAVLSTNATETGPDVSGVVTGAPAPTFAPRTGGGAVRLEAKDSGDYQLTIINSRGDSIPCATEAVQGSPCTIDGLPSGRTIIRIDDAEERELNLGEETVVIEMDGAAGWYGTASLLTLGGGFVVSVVGVTALASDDSSSGPDTSSLLFLTIGVPVLYTTSLVFGILWLLDKDEVSIKRFNKDTRSSRSDGDGFAGLDELEFDFGVVPAPGGGMAGFGVSW